MEDKYIAILGGLVGSGFTIFVTKIFDYFQAKQTHKLSLKKEFFLRKINVFDKAVSQMTIVQNTITNISILIETALNENASFTNEQSQDIFARLDNNVQTIYKATQETAGSIDLYIDFKRGDEEVEITQQFWETLGTINQLGQDISFGYELLNKATSEEYYKITEAAIEMNEKLLADNVGKLTNISSVIRKRTLTMVSQLRDELKQYE